MLASSIGFFEKVLGGIILAPVKDKIGDIIKQRNVERKIGECADVAGQLLDNYFQGEKLSEGQVELVIYEVQQAIHLSNINAELLASVSLKPEKLFDHILGKYPIPQSIREEKLEYLFEMALQVSAERLCEVALSFTDWEKQGWKRNFDGIDKILEKLNEIIDKIGSGGESGDEKFENLYYRSYLLRKLARIDASTLRASSSVSLDLTTVFVEPDVISISKLFQVQENEAQKIDCLISLENERQNFISRGESEDKRVAAETFIPQHKKCAIVGLPGSGKTTLLQHLLLVAANCEILFGETKGVVPVLIKIRELDLNNLPGADKLLQAAEGNQVLSDKCPGFLERQLEIGRVLLLIDGLDEVIPEKRQAVMAWIRAFVEMYPNSRYVISSRPAGYQSEEFQKLGFTEVTLCNFTSDQIRKYVQRWTTAIELSESKSQEEIEQASTESADALVDSTESNPYVRGIAANPLMLSTLCLVQKYEGGRLPNRRVVLYQRCVEGLLFHWDQKRGLPEAILGLPLPRKMLLLRRLAIEMQVEGVAEIEESKIEQSFINSLNEVGEKADVKQILANIRDRSGLLVERRPGIYGFSHLTFQEYLAALSIKEGDYKEEGKNYDRFFLFSQWSHSQWSEVIALYAGVASKDSVENILKALIQTKNPQAVILAGNCLAAAENPGLVIQKEVINELLSLSEELEVEGSNPISFTISEILNTLNEQIVMKQALAALDNLEVVNSVSFLLKKKDNTCIDSVFQAGKRILLGEQKPAKWDFVISLILLEIEDYNAADALGKLADIAIQKSCVDSSLGVLYGFWYIGFWSLNRRKITQLPGILNLFNQELAQEYHINLCKFIAVVSSENIFMALLQQEQVGDIFSDITYILDNRKSASLKTLIKKIAFLVEHSDNSLREYAIQASNNLLWCVSQIEKLKQSSEKTTAQEEQKK
ncbi:NACHT domain-containing protein [Desmonostoc muscorum LEGE 12446]|uniref:NACHT domain-containing protein n=1 Tax=Desmonostoc muscorum LEGE 12446 TaxID=1828758 RepID=A0A8J6ZR80_DESMC|nr:NACHT domain-containing protein [Desmonostoc muscorum]MCF2146182.1 NACHT domain-containing protein [Desmonostoc muscorum LEGE 12446]